MTKNESTGFGGISGLTKRKVLGKENKLHFDEVAFIILMLLIPITQFAVFWVGVNINSILMAFQRYPQNNWDLYNFEQVFEQLSMANSDLSVAIINTLVFFVKDLLLNVGNMNKKM